MGLGGFSPLISYLCPTELCMRTEAGPLAPELSGMAALS